MIRFSLTRRQSWLGGIKAEIDADPGDPKVELYSGALPATYGVITNQTRLVVAVIPKPCGTVIDDTLVFNDFVDHDDIAAIASGVIAWGRIVLSTGTVICEGDASKPGQGGMFVIDVPDPTGPLGVYVDTPLPQIGGMQIVFP